MKKPINVVIVDDHPGVRAAIKKLLVTARDINVVGEAANGVEALQLTLAFKPDIVLLDVEMPVMRGDAVVRRLREQAPGTKVLAVSSYDDSQYVQGMMDNGAVGYITKDEAPELLLDAVRRLVVDGGFWVSPRAGGKSRRY